MDTLHILGNGFDLQHGLPTSYLQDFKKLAVRDEHFPGEWECFSEVDDFWSDVEANLSKLDTSALIEHLEQFPPEILSDHESDRDGIILEASLLLRFPLGEFARNADASLWRVAPQEKFHQIFGPRDFFLTFNYTHTLEYLYGVEESRILHVHGEVGVNQLIMGYAPGELGGVADLREWSDEENYDYYRSTAHRILEERLLGFEKAYQTDRLSEFLEGLPSSIDQVSAYGLSFGMVDKPYFLQLSEGFRKVPWIIRGHRYESLDLACAALDSYGGGVEYRRQIF
ncbi:AbiH family protein [Schaalia sp. JY-X169]|uniref:AbiH family protein n=1 Tax=Schaalia sp. JY-X169 TaxID=2758572 RepID=UPI0015F3761A|nr:AbiH family protein [Schaalia sp. JY-X169]